MKNFIESALKKLPKMTMEQVKSVMASAALEVDRLQAVMESLTEGVLVSDRSHKLLLTNKNSERFLGIGSYEPRFQFVWDVIRDGPVSEFVKAHLLSGGRVLDEEFNITVNDTSRILGVSVLPLVKDREVAGSLVLVEEITEKRVREARLRRAESLANLTSLAAAVAHEIKNPLASISIHIQLMQKSLKSIREIAGSNKKLPEKFDMLDQYIEVVNEEIERLNHIVVDFLFAVRPMNIEPREGDINAMLEDLAEFVRLELEEANIEIKLELKPGLPPILFDERYMKQAILNLVKNAKSAMSDGGELKIKTSVDYSDVHINVSDNGVGIPKENLPKIFEPYFSTRASGLGLGLTMVYKIIKEHHGEINVISQEKMGSSFIITLPRPDGQRGLLTYGEESKEL